MEGSHRLAGMTPHPRVGTLSMAPFKPQPQSHQDIMWAAKAKTLAAWLCQKEPAPHLLEHKPFCTPLLGFHGHKFCWLRDSLLQL